MGVVWGVDAGHVTEMAVDGIERVKILCWAARRQERVRERQGAWREGRRREGNGGFIRGISIFQRNRIRRNRKGGASGRVVVREESILDRRDHRRGRRSRKRRERESKKGVNYC
jgi:hypothetical protein